MPSLSEDTFFYTLANWSRRLISLITAPITIAYFTPADYGYMNLVTTLASFCSILGILAVADQGLPRFFIDSKDEAEKKGYVATSFFISGIGVLLMTFGILISTPFISIIFEDVDIPLIFTALIALTCLSQSFHYVGSNMLKWTFQSSLFSKIIITKSLIGAGLSIGGIIFLGWRAKEVLFIGVLAALGAGVWANISVRQYIKILAISKKKIKELVAFSWPLLGINIFAFFTRSLDRIFLASLNSLGATGIFSVSSVIAGLFETAVSGFFFALGPYVLSTFREDWAPKRYAHYFSVIACFGIISIVGLGLWGGPIVMLFRPDGAYKQIGVFIPWIISGTLLYYLGVYFAPGPSITKKTYWNFIAFALAGTSNAALNYILIPILGILGAGIATTISGLVAAVFNQIVSNRLYFVPNPWRFSFAIILVFTSVVSMMQYEKFIYNIDKISYLSRLLLTIVLIILGILLFWKDIKNSGVIEKFSEKLLKIKR